MKTIANISRIITHKTSHLILICWSLAFYSLGYAQYFSENRGSGYHPILANPYISQSYIFTSIKNNKVFGGSIGRIFTIYSHDLSKGKIFLTGNASAKSLTNRIRTIFYLRDVDYLLGCSSICYLYNPKIWYQFSLQHISSHLGDEFLHQKQELIQKRQPITFSLEFVQFSLQKHLSSLRVECGINHIYHSTISLSKTNFYIGLENSILKIKRNYRLFASTYYSYSITNKYPLQHTFLIGIAINNRNTLPVKFVFEINKGKLFWGQFYDEKLNDYLIKIYLDI